MPIRTVKPTGNARRQLSVADFSVLDKANREKSLSSGKKRISGRNNEGKITVRQRGGAAKRLYRLVNFSQVDHVGQTAQVISIEYDPNRSAYIALIAYESGEKSYILAPEKLKKGDKIICDDKTAVKIGNRMKLKNIPVSSQIHNIEVMSGKGGQIVRSAGNYAALLGFDGDLAIIRLPSGEVRKVLANNFASIGAMSNADHSNIKIGKAGRSRLMGWRPSVRGKAQNPVDHPHGGGEGGSPIGMPYPKTPWGAPALGRRTRNKKKHGSALIISRRKK